MRHHHLLLTISNMTVKDLKRQNAIFLTIAIMNLSLNVTNLEPILKLGYVRIIKDLSRLLHTDPLDNEFDYHTYVFTFIRQILRINNLQSNIHEIFNQGATYIIKDLLTYDKQYFFRSLLECVNVMIINHPTY